MKGAQDEVREKERSSSLFLRPPPSRSTHLFFSYKFVPPFTIYQERCPRLGVVDEKGTGYREEQLREAEGKMRKLRVLRWSARVDECEMLKNWRHGYMDTMSVRSHGPRRRLRSFRICLEAALSAVLPRFPRSTPNYAVILYRPRLKTC